MKKSIKNNLITGLVLFLSVGAVGAVAGLTKGFTDWDKDGESQNLSNSEYSNYNSNESSIDSSNEIKFVDSVEDDGILWGPLV